MSDARKTDGTGGSELRDTLEGTGHGKRRKSGTYNTGVKDLASAYVLCPRLAECGVFRFMDGMKASRSNEGIGSRIVLLTRRRIRTEYLGEVEDQVTRGLV